MRGPALTLCSSRLRAGTHSTSPRSAFAGAPLKLVFRSDAGDVVVRSEIGLVPSRPSAHSTQRSCGSSLVASARRSFVLRDVDVNGLAGGLFIPVSVLNHLRQSAIAELEQRVEWDRTVSCQASAHERIRFRDRCASMPRQRIAIGRPRLSVPSVRRRRRARSRRGRRD